MTPIRKEFFRRLAFIALSIVPVIVGWTHTGPTRFIALAAMVFGLYQLIMIAAMSQSIIDDFILPETDGRVKAKPFEKFVHWSATVIFFAGLIFGIFEIDGIDNTINGTRFFWTYASIGILIAVVVTVVLKVKSPSVYFESGRRYTVHFGLFVGFFLIVPAAASFVNHYFADGKVDCKRYKVVRKTTGGRENRSSWIFLRVDGHEERFVVSRSYWNGVNEGGLVILCTQNGQLGYEFVRAFKTADV